MLAINVCVVVLLQSAILINLLKSEQLLVFRTYVRRTYLEKRSALQIPISFVSEIVSATVNRKPNQLTMLNKSAYLEPTNKYP